MLLVSEIALMPTLTETLTQNGNTDFWVKISPGAKKSEWKYPDSNGIYKIAISAPPSG